MDRVSAVAGILPFLSGRLLNASCVCLSDLSLSVFALKFHSAWSVCSMWCHVLIPEWSGAAQPFHKSMRIRRLRCWFADHAHPPAFRVSYSRSLVYALDPHSRWVTCSQLRPRLPPGLHRGAGAPPLGWPPSPGHLCLPRVPRVPGEFWSSQLWNGFLCLRAACQNDVGLRHSPRESHVRLTKHSTTNCFFALAKLDTLRNQR